jgi:two-component system, NtrC family, sensor kinase
MAAKEKPGMVQNDREKRISRFFKFRSSIYGQVVLMITILSIIMFAAFGLIFRSVYEHYINTVIKQNGNDIGSLVEGALYHSMMENDKRTLQNTLDIINTLPGIEDVNMYDSQDNPVYSSFSPESSGHIDPNCKNCHEDFASMFPQKEKVYRIIDADSQCKMSQNPGDHRHLLIRTPILNEQSCYVSECHYHQPKDEVLGSLMIKIPLGDLDEALNKSSAEFYLFATIATLILVSFLIFFTWRKIKKPLNALVTVSESVAKGDRSSRVNVKPGELEDMRVVSETFNEMLDHLQAATDELQNWSQQLEYKVQKKSEELSAVQNEIIHVERLASLGKLSSSVAHEINNPLSGILIYTKLIQKQLSNPELFASKRESMLQHLKMIESETKRCGDIVKGLLDFSRKEQEDFEPEHLHKIMQDTYELMMHPVKIANIAFRTDFTAKQDLIYCSPNQIKQACMALIVNSTEAIRENGEITVRTSNPDPDSVSVQIIDNGIGISAEDLPHIFEPFYSTKQQESGIGLGLAIVHGIVKSHNGKIQVLSEPGKGTDIIITFPLINT